jgi:hypothetical protein
MHFIFIYENIRMKPVELVLRKRGGGEGNDAGGECN